MGGRQAKMETEFWVNLVGGYEQRRAGRASDGKLACFERGGELDSEKNA